MAHSENILQDLRSLGALNKTICMPVLIVALFSVARGGSTPSARQW